MIDVIIEDRLTEWVFAHSYESLEEVLLFGWKGLVDYTDKELTEIVMGNFDEEQVKDYLESRKRRLDEKENQKSS